ncbi:hypothetical protein HDC92_001006 [Pedobacter sp. AK017]|nr:hypothetical protein [Pedobacter sp. AK017]
MELNIIKSITKSFSRIVNLLLIMPLFGVPLNLKAQSSVEFMEMSKMMLSSRFTL